MGQIIMSGIVPQLVAPSVGAVIGNLAVGSSVFMNINGAATEFLVVNQGIPSNSSLYDSSCNGTWLLMKNLYERMAWDSTNSDYENSDIHAYLNSTFFAMLDNGVQNAIKQVKIPYRKGTGSSGTTVSGSSGLSTRVFLLGGYEVGWNANVSYGSYLPVDGACLSYFSGTAETDEKRFCYYLVDNGSAPHWWLRSANTDSMSSANNVYGVYNGGIGYDPCTKLFGVRPAFILPSNTLIDEETMTVITDSSGSGGSGSTPPPSKPPSVTLTITGTGSDRCRILLPDGTLIERLSATATYELEVGSTLDCQVRGMESTNYGTIVLNGQTIYNQRTNVMYTYTHTLTKNLTINLTTSSTNSTITITEEG